MYIDKLDDVVSNTYHRTIKMKPVDVKSSASTKPTLAEKLKIKILNLKLVILLEYQNIKIFLRKILLIIGLKKFLSLQKLKILCCGHMLLVILKAKELLERFKKKKKKKRIAKNKSKKFRVGKVIKRKGDKLYVKWKGYDRIALLTVGLIK